MKTAFPPIIFFQLALFTGVSGGQQAPRLQTPANLEPYVFAGTKPSIIKRPVALAVPGSPIQVGVKLTDAPLAVVAGPNAKQNGIKMTAAQQVAYLAQIRQKQNLLMSQISGLGGAELGRASKSQNVLMVSIPANQLNTVKSLAGVAAVRPLSDFHTELAVTLPYIGATAVQNTGVTGKGVRVAMLDTGIDYTHYNLGGSGSVADYQAALAAAAQTPPANLFPTAKVIGGYDFTGDVWPNGPLAPDPNPIDIFGHGSHTADIVGGKSLDGKHVGTAPDSQLYAVKVCSSVSSSCSGVAILEGLDFALDPNNTGTLNDAVDIISMSIGGDFGQREDDQSEAFTNIVQFGVVGVVSDGNSGDIPYISGNPSTAPEVIAVGATQGVTATTIPLVINSPASIAGTYSNTATISFAPVNSTVTANVAYLGRGCPATASTPADPYPPGVNLTGQIALIDRGACAVSLKIDRAANAGAAGVLIALTAPGDAITFSSGGGTNFVPTLVITQATGGLIETTAGTVNATISPNNQILLAGDIASYSSRGPNYSYSLIKPDLSAPGTIVAADAGTGNGQSSESGTSFACPLTAGSAALLLSQNRSLGPLDIKAILMETTEVTVHQNSATEPGVLAPITRAGAGELRVDRAVAASTAVWDAGDPLAVSLSFGALRTNINQTLKKKVIVRNYSNSARTYNIVNTYRLAPNTSGVTITAPSSISVPANSSASFAMTLNIAANALPVWPFSNGANVGLGSLLQAVEYAGYLTFNSGSENVHIPWHVLPHQAANVQPASFSASLNGQPTAFGMSNAGGAATSQVDVFSLTGTGTQFPASVLPAPGDEFAVVNLRATGLRLVCLASCSTASPAFGVQFAVTTFGQRAHPDVPAEFDFDIDVNNDGVIDLVVFNEDIGLATTGINSGQNGVFVADVTTGLASGPYYYTNSDLNSSNVTFTVPLSSLVTSTNLALTTSTPFTYLALAFDNYYTGNLTDLIGPMQYELDMPAFYPSQISLAVPPNTSPAIEIFPNNAANPFFTGPYNGNSPSQSGLLFMYTNGKTGQEADIVTVKP